MIDFAALTRRLVRIRSVSPNPAGETECVRAVLDALPPGVDHGTWEMPDGRLVMWARLRGHVHTPRQEAVLMLGHADTVGAKEFGGLDDDRGEAVAFDPDRLRDAFVKRLHAGLLPEAVAKDVLEEIETPATWLFGRGALDMKAGLVAGLAAFTALAADPPGGDVWFVVTPDEEHESAGMLSAVDWLAEAAIHERLRFLGAINLDYADAPLFHAGVKGKLLAGLWVAGVPTHASDPAPGLDAATLAAEVALHATRNPELVSLLEAPPVLLRLRDRKEHYDAQTAAEAEVHVNLMVGHTPPEQVLRSFERAVAYAVSVMNIAGSALERPPDDDRAWTGHARRHGIHPATQTMYRTWPLDRSGDTRPRVAEAGLDADIREITLQRVREAAFAAGVPTPAIVSFLLPPLYPASMHAAGRLAAATRRVCAAEGIADGGPYPHISDLSYLRWPAEASEVAREIPTFHREYRLPVDAMKVLDMDVLNVGPWGRDAHGLYERVFAPYAFERLPRLLERIVRAAFTG